MSSTPNQPAIAPPPSPLHAAMCWLRSDALLQRILLFGVLAFLTVFVIFPLIALVVRAVHDKDGAWIGLANFIEYFGTAGLRISLWNSIRIAVISTTISVTIGFAFAYALTRTRIVGVTFFRSMSMIPLYAPTMLYGIALVYLFGNQGLITRGFFGALPGIDIGLYGPVGIVIAEVVFIFPAVVLVLTVALQNTDRRLYEAAESMGAGNWRIFWAVTIPGCRYGLLSAVLIGFILSFTDFGAPKVVGGNYSVLAVDIYKQVVGQQNFSMGATVSLVLLMPTGLAFIADRIIQRRQTAAMTAKAVPYEPKPNRVRDTCFFLLCAFVVVLLLLIVVTPAFVSCIYNWPYSLSDPSIVEGQVFSGHHFDFTGKLGNAGGNWLSSLGIFPAFIERWINAVPVVYANSITMALLTAIIGTAVTFISAYLIEKMQTMRLSRSAAYLVSIVPLALPGLVIGLSYIFIFNQPTILGIRNPLTALYGTMAILVACNIIHFYGVSFLTATTAL
ncbi:MAG: ABC transporter permease subunit, partial [Rhodospirillales bacterium]|nr:ABC transporter permease subunit [Rhodospirillales bacterium]